MNSEWQSKIVSSNLWRTKKYVHVDIRTEAGGGGVRGDNEQIGGKAQSRWLWDVARGGLKMQRSISRLDVRVRRITWQEYMRCNVVWHALTRYTATIIRGRTFKVENFASTNSSSWNQNGMKELFHNASHEQGVSLFHVQLLLLVISLLCLYGELSLHNLWFIHFEIFHFIKPSFN